jgi:hypothetical protein
MNQRPGKTHSAAATDGRQNVDLMSLIKYAQAASAALKQEGEEDASHYFEMFEEFLRKDVANGKPFGFTYKSLGL